MDKKFINFLKWSAVSALAFAGCVLILNLVGDLLISEISQEVRLFEGDQAATSSTAILGKKAPYFELLGIDGHFVKSTDFLGRRLLIIFWTTWNSASADQVGILDEYLASAPATAPAILAISSQEDRSAVGNFVRRGGYRLPVLSDPTGATGERYEARVLPAYYFVDEKGIIRDIHIGLFDRAELEERIKGSYRSE